MRTYLIVVAGLMLLSSPSFAQSQTALDGGEVFVESFAVNGSDVPKLVVTAVVDAPPSKVYEVVTNCDRFEDRLPRVLEAKTLKKSKSGHTCEVTIDLPFPLANLTAVTRDRRREGPDVWSREWTLLRGDYEANTGGFVLKPFAGDANRTLLVYSIHAVPKTLVPDALRERAQKRSLPKMIERIRREVKQL